MRICPNARTTRWTESAAELQKILHVLMCFVGAAGDLRETDLGGLEREVQTHALFGGVCERPDDCAGELSDLRDATNDRRDVCQARNESTAGHAAGASANHRQATVERICGAAHQAEFLRIFVCVFAELFLLVVQLRDGRRHLRDVLRSARGGRALLACR
jgi:hypothetical protein